MSGCTIMLVPAVVAAVDDRDVGLGDLGHGDRIVDRTVHDLVAAFGKPVAHLVRGRRDLQIDLDAAPGENPFSCAANSGRFCRPWNTITVSLVCAWAGAIRAAAASAIINAFNVRIALLLAS